MRNAYADSIPADWEQFAAVFSALGDSYRQRILLFFEPGERLTIKQIADVLPLSRTAVCRSAGEQQGRPRGLSHSQ
jgi:DNA-binding GntR family transcriptional regulator